MITFNKLTRVWRYSFGINNINFLIVNPQHGEVTPAERDKLYYVSVDGSMYFTREEGRKEIKLGRIYKQEDLIPVSDGRTVLAGSLYVAHLGNIKDFRP